MKNRTSKEHPQEIKDAILMIMLFCIGLIISCSTTKTTPEQKAFEAKEARIKLLNEVRREFPCDTATVYITQTDTAYLTSAPDTIVKNGIQYITKDRTITKTVEKQVVVIDRAAEQQKRDSIDNLLYTNGQITGEFNKYVKETDIKIHDLQADNQVLKKYRNIIYGIVGIASLAGIFFALRAFKIINI
jgi:hypothetical protein